MYCGTMQYMDDQLPFRARSSNRATKSCSRALKAPVFYPDDDHLDVFRMCATVLIR
jgi:hypothetical protein